MAYLVRASRTMTLWHGGNLDESVDNMSQKGGRWEYGPGLYLITTYSVAQKYAKGSRKLYRVTISEGTDITKVKLPMEDVKEFLAQFCIKTKFKDVTQRMEKWDNVGQMPAENFLIILINEQAIKNTRTAELRSFLVSHGIDYWFVNNAFGFAGKMVVLFNMKKIVSKERMSGKDIEVFDLPTDFS